MMIMTWTKQGGIGILAGSEMTFAQAWPDDKWWIREQARASDASHVKFEGTESKSGKMLQEPKEISQNDEL